MAHLSLRDYLTQNQNDDGSDQIQAGNDLTGTVSKNSTAGPASDIDGLLHTCLFTSRKVSPQKINCEA